MKVLIYSDCFIFGGSENVIENLLKSEALTDKYEFQFYYAYNIRYKKSVDEKFPGFKNIHSLAILSAFSKWGYESKLNKTTSSLWQLYIRLRYLISLFFEKANIYNAYNYRKLLKLFKKEKPAILYINDGGYPGAQSCRIAVLSAKKAGIDNIIFNVNNLALPQSGLKDKKLDEKIDTVVKNFITASKAAKQKLIEERKFTIIKCIDIPNTLSEEKETNAYLIEACLRNEFKIKDEEVVIGAAGLLTERKGFDVLIKAIHLFHDSNNIFKVFIFGEGEQRSILEKMIRNYGLEKKIFLPGYKKNMQPYIKDFDVLVCPSVANEDFPYIILEAMLLSKPVIGTNIAGIPEQVIDSYNGFIVAPKNTEALAEAIRKLLSNKQKIKKMGVNSYKRYSENFNNHHIIHLYDELFKSVN